MSKAGLDEDFLRWWATRLEKKGIDLDEKQVKISAHPPSTPPAEVHLYQVYSYNECFEAMRRGDYWPLVSYAVAYRGCCQSILEDQANADSEIVLPWKKPAKKSRK